MFNNKSIIITGGTGSFGHECTSLLLKKYKPKKIIIFSRDEFKQYQMQKIFNKKCMRYFIGDVRDEARLMVAFRKVDYVIHAAALKQVPAAEYNPTEYINTNIMGAQNVIKAALYSDVKMVMALSTDKAVNPINLYGATKLASDKLFVAANNIAGGHRTRFSITRYGNVVGSRGSVLPVFQELISKKNNFLPITDERMTRFWINLSDGVNFVLKNFYRMHGGEIFIPKIPSIRITDLAKAIAPNIKIKVVGIRPGEKLHEAMCIKEESEYTFEYKDFYVVKSAISFLQKKKNKTRLNETGRKVKENFEYNSSSNTNFLNLQQIKNYK
jgi:UDP-N-acetylglucosamine 4,6-dehydratase